MDLKAIAIKKATQSNCRYKVSAIGLNKRGEYIGSAINKPFIDRKGGGLHAEKNLIQRYGNKIKTIIICRVNISGNILPIHPCQSCSKLANKLGIKILSLEQVNE